MGRRMEYGIGERWEIEVSYRGGRKLGWEEWERSRRGVGEE